MKKKLLALLIATVSCAVLVACGEAETKRDTKNDDFVVEEKESEEDEEEIEEVITCPDDEHEWGLRTLEAPMTCEVCGAIKGEPISMTITTVTAPDGDDSLDFMSMGYETHVWSDTDPATNLITLYNMDGEQINQYELEYDGVSDGWGCWYYSAGDHFFIETYGMKDCGAPNSYNILNQDGDLIYELGAHEELYHIVTDNNGDAILVIYDDQKGTCCYSAETGEEVEFSDDYKYWGSTITQSEEWTKGIYDMVYSDYYLAGNDSEWAILDEDYNVLATYLDISEFNMEGYALASNDRESYFIIDADLNVVSDSVIPGCSAVYKADGDYFKVKCDNGGSIVIIE